MILKNATVLVACLFLLNSCGGEKSKNENEGKTNGTQVEYAQKVKNSFPAFETLLCTLDSIYDYGLDKEYNYSIAKKPEGFFIEVFKYQNRENQHKESIQVWDLKTNSYKRNALQSYISRDGEPYGFYNRNSSYIQNYDFHLFYGYDDYFDNVISFYDDKSNLCDEDYEILSRAHDTKSISYIYNGQWGFKSTSLKGNKDPYYSKVSKERVDGFIYNVNLTQKYLELIQKRNPEYKTHLIGDVNLKIANNYIHIFQILMSVKEKDLALKYLEKVNYNDEYIQIAKNYLNDCDKNSFLFTHGDNDSYPIWYVQEFMNYRKDVNVFNLSLLGATWYQKMIRERNQLNLNLDIDLANDYKCYALYTIGSEPINDVIELFNKSNFNDDGYKIDSIHRANLVFDYKGQNVQLYSREYQFDLSKLFVIDVIQNYPNSSIYFTSKLTPTNGYKSYRNIAEIANSWQFDTLTMQEIEKDLSAEKISNLLRMNDFSVRNKLDTYVNLIIYSMNKDVEYKDDIIEKYYHLISDEFLMERDFTYNLSLKYLLLNNYKSGIINRLLNQSSIWQLMVDRVGSMTFNRKDIFNNQNDLLQFQKIFENIDRYLKNIDNEKLEKRQFESKEKIFLIIDKLIEDKKINNYPKTLSKVKEFHKYLLDAIIDKKKENIEKIKLPSAGGDYDTGLDGYPPATEEIGVSEVEQ